MHTQVQLAYMVDLFVDWFIQLETYHRLEISCDAFSVQTVALIVSGSARAVDGVQFNNACEHDSRSQHAFPGK